MMGFCVLAVQAQSNVNDLFAAGVEDAETFMNDYLAPVSEGAIYSIAGSWFNTGDAKPLGGFEISVIGNLTGFKNKEDKKTFVLNSADYQNLQFVDGSTSKTVSTALGDIQGIRVFVEDEVAPGVTAREEFELPSGLAAEDINFIPSGYIQGSVGLIKGTEIKARFLPKIDTDDVAISLYGVGIQHEFTKHLPADKILPIAISGVIGYTHINGTYDFTDTNIIAGSDQRIDAKINTWVFQAVVSTKLPIINFYGSWAVRALSPATQELAFTTEEAWIDMNRNDQPDSNELVARWPVIVSGQQGEGAFVVFADDAIFQNRFLTGDNLQLARNLVAWLGR